MSIQTIATRPFSDQRPGTSGLRKKVAVFMQPYYLDNFVQALLDVLNASGGPDVPRESGGSGGEARALAGQTLILGGDGRFFNRTAIQTILKLAAANGLTRVVMGCGGILSTPAASAVIRRRQAFGGILLSASHNPGGADGDFGIKYNMSNGGPATETLTEAIYARTQVLNTLYCSDAQDVCIDKIGRLHVEHMQIEVIDPVGDYAAVMRSLFDFDLLSGLFASGFLVRVDAMNAVGGPYAKQILEGEIGAPLDSVVNFAPLEDFGGHHPDPNPANVDDLIYRMSSKGMGAPKLGAALDGDADRNLVMGRNFLVTPSDSLALLTQYARLIPAYQGGLAGVARSMPTSTAVDRVAKALGIPCYETPTGWKFFGNLLDAGLVTLCGEESYGTGSSHLREKDGLWAILFWLSVIAVTGQSMESLVRDHWKTYGRSYYSRHDYLDVPVEYVDTLMKDLHAKLPALAGQTFGRRTILVADDFAYTDPVDGSTSSHQGVRLVFDDASRLIFRVSGTSTEEATLRLYMERFEPDPACHCEPVALAVAELSALAEHISKVRVYTRRAGPTIAT